MPRHFSNYNKYGNTRTPCKQFGGKCKKKHDSTAEANRCNTLAIAERAGRLTYDVQARYDFWVDGVLIGYHQVDFVITFKGETYVEDVKGAKTHEWILKYKLFIALYPNIRYVVNFGGNFGKGTIPKIRKTPANNQARLQL